MFSWVSFSLKIISLLKFPICDYFPLLCLASEKASFETLTGSPFYLSNGYLTDTLSMLDSLPAFVLHVSVAEDALHMPFTEQVVSAGKGLCYYGHIREGHRTRSWGANRVRTLSLEKSLEFRT